MMHCKLRFWKNTAFLILVWTYLFATLLLVFYRNHAGVSRFVPDGFTFCSTKGDGGGSPPLRAGATTPWWEPYSPLVDRSQENRSESDILLSLQKKFGNLPFSVWNSARGKTLQLNRTCAPFPSIYGLEFNNGLWQTVISSNGTYYIYGSYYDNRTAVAGGSVVRLLVMLDRIQPTLRMHCQIWNPSSSQPHIAVMRDYLYLWNKKWGNYRQGVLQPYLLTCPVPAALVPHAVSLVEQPCSSATNLLPVHNRRTPPKRNKQNFAVCVKGLDFPYADLSVRLVEWLELLRILGAHRVFFYELEVHPNISRVIRYYSSKEGNHFVETSPLSLPGGQPNLPGLLHLYLRSRVNNKRQNEIIPYNDCFYRNIYLYHYVVLLDIDEVIVPVKSSTWVELMNEALRRAVAQGGHPRASYNVRNVYFFDGTPPAAGGVEADTAASVVPPFMHMLRHVHRSRNFTRPGHFVKCFHSTERVLALHNHYPLACLTKTCSSFSIGTDLAQLHHYRKDCVKVLNKSCGTFRANLLEDRVVWRYKDRLINNTVRVLKALSMAAAAAGGGGSE